VVPSRSKQQIPTFRCDSSQVLFIAFVSTCRDAMELVTIVMMMVMMIVMMMRISPLLLFSVIMPVTVLTSMILVLVPIYLHSQMTNN